MLTESEQQQLLSKLEALHSGDERQLEAIFSTANRLIVEAPAGYGKTKTMISKVAYLLATGKIARPKKILALTFSVNAAHKVKKELAENLPSLIRTTHPSDLNINEKLFVSNYHGFCRHILKKYGYLLHPNLSDIDLLTAVDDSKAEEITSLLEIPYEKASNFTRFGDAVKTVNRQYLANFFNQYVDGIIESFIGKGYISFNGIIALTLKLFDNYSEIANFYRDYFPVVIVDEFQDTNALSWRLLRILVSDQTQVFFLGDSLQRIYGFIGAIPNLLSEAEQLLSMDRIALSKNYRFMSNLQMLRLDKNIRLNAEKPDSPEIQENAHVPFTYSNSQSEEAEEVLGRINQLISLESKNPLKLAILTNQRGLNINKIIEVFSEKGIPYFYALFGDDDPEYLFFHRECSNQFFSQLREDFRVSKESLRRFYIRVENIFQNQESPTIKSLLSLLEVFLIRITANYSFLSAEDKITLIKDAFENKALKQNLEYINESVVISTIHGAKGLEWDYVLIPDMEQYSIPNWYGLCGNCTYKRGCNLVVSSSNEKKFLETLSVFYVGVTRARKQVYFFGSKTRLKYNRTAEKTNLSCMLTLPGITLIAPT